jgi:hypothetical protein
MSRWAEEFRTYGETKAVIDRIGTRQGHFSG